MTNIELDYMKMVPHFLREIGVNLKYLTQTSYPIIEYKETDGSVWIEPFESLYERGENCYRINGRTVSEEEYSRIKGVIKALPNSK